MKRTVDNELLLLDNLSKELISILSTIENITPLVNKNFDDYQYDQPMYDSYFPSEMNGAKEDLAEITDTVNKLRQSASSPSIGEYRWVEIGTPLEEGWIKYDIPTGYTLVQGDEDETTLGAVLNHRHNFDVTFTPTSTLGYHHSMDGYTIKDNTTYQEEAPYERALNLINGETDWFGNKEGNFATGYNAELWRYEG